MGESKVYDFTKNETENSNSEATINNEETIDKVDLAKAKEYESQVDESIKAATNTDEHLDDKINLSKNEEQSVNNSEQYNNVNYQQYNNQYQQQNGQYQQYNNYNNQYQQNEQYQQYNNQMNNGVVTPDKLVLEPAMACVVSCLLTGLGQMINGQIEKGLLLLFGGMGAIFVIALLTCGIGAILSPLVIVVSALDAYKCAKRLQMGQSIGKYEFHIFD